MNASAPIYHQRNGQKNRRHTCMADYEELMEDLKT